VQNTKISDMHTRLSQSHDMKYIAGYYNMDIPHLQNVQFYLPAMLLPWPPRSAWQAGWLARRAGRSLTLNPTYRPAGRLEPWNYEPA